MADEITRREFLRGLAFIAGGAMLPACTPSYYNINVSNTAKGQLEGDVSYLLKHAGEFNVYAVGDCGSSMKDRHLFFDDKDDGQKFVPPKEARLIGPKELEELANCTRGFEGYQFHTTPSPDSSDDIVPVWYQKTFDPNPEKCLKTIRDDLGRIKATFERFFGNSSGGGVGGLKGGGRKGEGRR